MFNLNTIINKLPFMYEIGDTVYYIGFGVFQKCNDPRSFYEFNRYRALLSAIDREPLSGEKTDPAEIAQLVYAFKQVRKLSNGRNTSGEDANEVKKRFEEAAERMSLEEKTQLTNQVNEFIWVYKLSEP